MTNNEMSETQLELQDAVEAHRRQAFGSSGRLLHCLEEEMEERGEMLSTIMMEWELEPGLEVELERVALAERGHRP